MSDKPIVIYHEYFHFNLKRSEGRKVPANWTEKDIQEIIDRYWSKAVAKGEG